MALKDTYWINCEYCGAPVECKRHPRSGGRTNRKYCYTVCARRAEALRKEERELTKEV